MIFGVENCVTADQMVMLTAGTAFISVYLVTATMHGGINIRLKNPESREIGESPKSLYEFDNEKEYLMERIPELEEHLDENGEKHESAKLKDRITRMTLMMSISSTIVIGFVYARGRPISWIEVLSGLLLLFTIAVIVERDELPYL
ncbi:hypothetical protein ACFQL4_13175 [Halosimplex aquaticum]